MKQLIGVLVSDNLKIGQILAHFFYPKNYEFQ
jgi:hypothetical protein